MTNKTSADMRSNQLFMRNTYSACGKYGIPHVRKQLVELNTLSLIACSDTRANDCDANKKCGVHFFVDDYRFEGIYQHPEKSLERLSQYAFLLTPDFSTYADMAPWRQIESVAHNRWCGAFWQDKGLTVIPTISWSTPSSYEYCFEGVEKNAIVAVGMIGCKRNKIGFLRGYHAMLERLEPETVICFGTPFAEMEGNLITVDYRASRKVVR